MTEIRQLFAKNERYEIITLDELKRTYVLSNELRKEYGNKAHHEVVQDIINILVAAGQAPLLEHIYITEKGGSSPAIKTMNKEDFRNLDNWNLRKVTGKIMLPNLTVPGITACIAFAYHEKGIDVAFGHDVHDCSNMCIYGKNILHTWGKSSNVDYSKMLEVLKLWSTNLPKMHERDVKIIQSMMSTNVKFEDVHRFLGRLYLQAQLANTPKSGIDAPLNVSEISKMTKGVIDDNGVNALNDNIEINLWKLYNSITNVLKVQEDSDITSLLTDVAEVGNMLIQEFAIPIVEVEAEEIPNSLSLTIE